MTNENKHIISVDDDSAGLRLDKFIATKLPDISRTRIKTLIENNSVFIAHQVSFKEGVGVQGEEDANVDLLRAYRQDRSTTTSFKEGNLVTITDCSYRVKSGEEFSVIVPEVKESEMRANDKIELNIAYEDDDFLVIDKQAGLTVHPGAGNYDETMANALMAYCGDTLSGVGGVARPGIVHRLDKDTSGLILVAKNDAAHHGLSEQIAERTLERLYLAVCWGVPKPYAGTIESNIARHPKNRLKMAVVKEGGKVAITHYTVKKIYGNGIASLVECRLQTGRTHQIRVHMSEGGNPLIGDQLYAPRNNNKLKYITPELREFLKGFTRQALHSYRIGVEHPVTGEYIELESELPSDIRQLLELLKGLKNLD